MKTYIIKFDGVTQLIKSANKERAINKFKTDNSLRGLINLNIKEVKENEPNYRK